MTGPRGDAQGQAVLARFFLLLLLLVGAAPRVFAVALGATKEEVIGELGQPAAQALRGNIEILTYPKGVRLTLEGGRVVSADKLTLSVEEYPEAIEEEPKPTPARRVTKPAASAPAAATKPQPTTPPPAATKAATRAPTAAPTADGDTEAIREMSKPPAEQAQALRQQLGAVEPALGPQERTTDDLPLFGKSLLLGVHLVLTLVSLLIAFRVWGMNALNSGIFAIAVIDLLLHIGFQALGPLTSGISTMSVIEYGIPGIVMVFTIHHFCFSKNLSDAVRTAALVKILVAILRLGASALLMRQTFG